MRGFALILLALGLGDALHASDWPKYCANLAMTGVAASGGDISRVTVHALKPVWSIRLAGPIASSPTVAHDIVYIGDWGGIESAIAASTGEILAQQNLGITKAPQCDPSTLGITSAAAYVDGTIYLAGGNDSFYALNATTLAIRWQVALGDNSADGGYYGWCSPAVVEDKVLQGISSNCDEPFIPGKLVSLDTHNGAHHNEAPMVVPHWPQTFSGAGVWTSPAVDMKTREVFITTGSANDVLDGDSFSIVRLSLDSLVIEDRWKIDPGTAEDADWGSSPTLFTDANGRRMVGAGQKDGHYYAFSRANLAAGPVWRTPLAQEGACPLCGDGILSTAAFDDRRLYVGAGKLPQFPDALGSITALDPTSGTILWQQRVNAPVIAPISYTNGVVFATAGSRALALDADTGEILWAFSTKAQCVGGIAITNRGIFFGDLSGTLYSFAIPPAGPPRRRAG
jgi:polyvinyl alcohol dehydrogenase (cytochrome)